MKIKPQLVWVPDFLRVRLSPFEVISGGTLNYFGDLYYTKKQRRRGREERRVVEEVG